MKRIMVWCVGCVVAVPIIAGQMNLRNEPAIKAKVAIAGDADASVKWATIKDDLDAVGLAIDALDLSTFDPGQWTGTQKTEMQDLKALVASLKAACRNQMQATNKIVKKLKETERITREVQR